MNHHSTDLIVALDYPRPEQAFAMVDQLKGLPVLFKVGLELFLSGGPEVVRELVHRKHRVMLDLKFHDIPATVAKAAKQAAVLQVDMITVHLSGGVAMIRAIHDEWADIPLLRPRIIGVTVLTSFDDVKWAELTRATTGHAVDVAESVNGLLAYIGSVNSREVPGLGRAGGLDGVVCSALEVSEISKKYPSLYTVVPGIRPQGTLANDQARVVTPQQARATGASGIVVGRPITKSNNPRAMVEAILAQISPQPRAGQSLSP